MCVTTSKHYKKHNRVPRAPLEPLTSLDTTEPFVVGSPIRESPLRRKLGILTNPALYSENQYQNEVLSDITSSSVPSRGFYGKHALMPSLAFRHGSQYEAKEGVDSSSMGSTTVSSVNSVSRSNSSSSDEVYQKTKLRLYRALKVVTTSRSNPIPIRTPPARRHSFAQSRRRIPFVQAPASGNVSGVPNLDLQEEEQFALEL